MPYLRVDLDGKKKWPMVAQGLRVSRGDVAAGFTDLWEMVFNTREDSVSLMQLECLFNAPGERVAKVLEAFGFLEALPDVGLMRVRGAESYLLVGTAIEEGGRRGGRATAKGGKGLQNLKQNRPKPMSDEGENTEASPKPPPKPHRSLTEASPKPLHHAPNTIHQVVKSLAGEAAPAPEKTKDPRLKPLTDQLGADYLELRGEKYPHRGAADAVALKELLKDFTPELIRERWGFALKQAGWLQANSFAQLRSKWADLRGAETQPDRKGVQHNGTDEEFQEKSKHLKATADGYLVLE